MSIIFWSLWRRLYGEGRFKKYLSRTLQTIIAIIVLSLQLTINNSWQQTLIALGVAIWMIIQYWSRAVGEIIDAGLNPTQGRKEYDRWFRPICNWIAKLLHIRKYHGAYDWIYSSMRNFIGLFPAMIIYPAWQWWILVFCMYPIYLSCFEFFKVFPNSWKNKLMQNLTLNEPKNLAELIHGGIFGLVMETL